MELPINSYYTERIHQQTLTYEDKILRLYNIDPNTNLKNDVHNFISYDNAIYWLTAVSNILPSIEFIHLPHVPKEFIFRFIAQTIQKQSSSNDTNILGSIIGLLNNLIDSCAREINLATQTLSQPTSPIDAHFIPSQKINDIQQLIQKHEIPLQWIKEYFDNKTPETFKLCISKLFLEYNWTNDYTMVMIMNRLEMCENLQHFEQLYYQEFTQYDLMPFTDQITITPEWINNTLERILSIMTFQPDVKHQHPISIFSLISYHLLFLFHIMLLNLNDDNDTSTIIARSVHSMGMVIVDTITDRITEESIQHNHPNEEIKIIMSELKRKNIRLPSSTHDTSINEHQLDKNIQQFVEQNNLNPSYSIFLKTLHLPRSQRVHWKLKEFIQKVLQTKTTNDTDTGVELNPEQISEKLVKSLMDEVTIKINEVTQHYPTIGNKKPAIVYDMNFITKIFKNPTILTIIRLVNPSIANQFESLL